MFGSDSTKVRIVFQDGDHHGVVYGYIVEQDELFVQFKNDNGRDMSIGKRYIHKIEAVGGA